MELQTEHGDDLPDPLESIEQAAMLEQLAYERDEFELHLVIPGTWSNHQIWFSYRPDLDIIYIYGSLDLKVPKNRYQDICELIVRVNERLAVGHFVILSEENAIVFHHCVSLPTSQKTTPEHGVILINAAKEAGESFYPAFNYLVWSGKTPKEAVTAAMFETIGEA